MQPGIPRVLSFIILLVVLPVLLLAQAADSTRNDTLSIFQKQRKLFKEFTETERVKSVKKYEEGRNANLQEEVISQIKRISLESRSYVKDNIDTSGILRELEVIDSLYQIAGDGVFTNRGTSQTHRNLTTTNNILKELYTRAVKRKAEVDAYRHGLIRYQFQLDSLNSDSALYFLPADSVALVDLLNNLLVVAMEIAPADSALEKAISSVQKLQLKTNLTVNRLDNALEQIRNFRNELSGRTFQREFADIWGTVGYSRPIKDIIHYSLLKDGMALRYYVNNNAGKIVFCIIVIIAICIFLKSMKRNLHREGMLSTDYSGQLVFRYPVYSGIMIGVNLLQFIFPDPPFVFSVLLWIIGTASLTIIFWGFISRSWTWLWLIMVVLFLVACADNIMLQASRAERWLMLILAIAGLMNGAYFLIWGKRSQLREPAILFFIGFVVVLEFSSIIANMFGRYNLAKIFMTSGFINVIIAIMFLWTVRLINELLGVASKVYRTGEKKLLYIDFERIGKKVPFIFYVLLIIGWFVLFGRNFYAFKLITEPIIDFFARERTIGNYSFSIDNLIVFILIVAVSAITSKVVSFFASDYHPSGDDTKKAGVGSWLLLIRIAIISLGLFLACAAAGIPMDRITIILGALGVGIGLGLQELTNSLVSGLIIAFEKPVNVGDIVEVAGQSGTVKSIGFRSSVISTWDGADVVMPNGALLNSNLVNWTMSNMHRRVEILVGVAYGTDLDKAKQILEEVLNNEKRILKFPAPAVLLRDFNNSSIDCRILFWVGRIEEWIATKSDVIIAIDMAFKENGITIPFPQQDIYIHQVNTGSEEDKTAGNKS